MKNYLTLANSQTYQKAIAYLDRLKAGDRAGKFLHHRLKNVDLDRVTVPEFIELLMILPRWTYLALSPGIVYRGRGMIFISVLDRLMMA